MLNKKDHFIIGSGFIASSFKKHLNFIKKNNIIIYAAGISNSLEVQKKNLNVEISRFKKFIKDNKKKLVYISTYSVNDNSRKNKLYVKNKIKIEKIIKSNNSEYIIIRLPEIIGKSKNPNTLTNFFYNNLIENKPFKVFKNSRRNLLDIDDAIKNCIRIIKINKSRNKIINLLNKKFYTPLQIVKNFEKILNKKGIYKFNNTKLMKWNLKNNFFFYSKENYLIKTLKKYYI
jgi:nucleoside-diphosphate-sugar epimerase